MVRRCFGSGVDSRLRPRVSPTRAHQRPHSHKSTPLRMPFGGSSNTATISHIDRFRAKIDPAHRDGRPAGTAAGRRLSWRRPGAPRVRVCCARPPRPAGSRSARRMSRATRATQFIRADDRFQVRALRLQLPAAVGPSSTLFFSNLQGVGGGEGGIRTHVPVTRQDAFEAPPLRPLRYLSAIKERGRRGAVGHPHRRVRIPQCTRPPRRPGWRHRRPSAPPCPYPSVYAPCGAVGNRVAAASNNSDRWNPIT